MVFSVVLGQGSRDMIRGGSRPGLLKVILTP
jgi:hypothetical protein